MEDFTMTLYFAAPADAVWEAITGDEGNRAVMWGSTMRGELRPGERYEFVGPGETGEDVVHVYGEVLEAEPGVALSLSEHPGPGYRENHAELRSRMTWRLTPAGDGQTRLDFTSDEWTEGHPAHAESAQTWPLVLSSLKSWVETGKALVYPG